MRTFFRIKRMMIAILFTALAVFAASAHAQDRPRSDVVIFPPNGEPKKIARLADLPPLLATAVGRTSCRSRRGAGARSCRAVPTAQRLSRHGGRAVRAIVAYSHAFFIERGRKPRLLYFPVVSMPHGFSASERPGMLRWRPDTKQLIATGHNDLCGSAVARHPISMDRAS